MLAGGLMSYGASRVDAWQKVGVYAGQILRGAKPAGMPVLQSSKLEPILNMAIAKSLNFTISPKLLARAYELIQ
jgi:putative ABC transport system substrate-binding protein